LDNGEDRNSIQSEEPYPYHLNLQMYV